MCLITYISGDEITNGMVMAHLVKQRLAERGLAGKPEGKSPLGIPVRRWEDNIKVDLQEVVWGMDWIDLAEDRDAWGLL